MTEPLREEALQSVVSILEGLVGIRPWGGQYPSKPTVSRRYREIVQTTEWPYLIVLQASGSTLGIENLSATFKHDFRFMVYGYVHGDDVISPSQWLARLQDDVLKTLLEQNTLAGAAATIEPGEDRTDEGSAEPFGGFVQYFTARLYEAVAME